MAGIGLTLRKLTEPHTYVHSAFAYVSSGIISAGPWLISVLSLALLQGAVAASLSTDDRQMLFATITYAFVASLVLTGPFQFVLTRVVADHIFLRQPDAVAPAFSRVLSEAVLLLTFVLVPFLALAPFDLAYRLLAGSLLLTVSLTWLALATLSAAQDYLSIVLAFALGYAISGGAAVWLGRHFGLEGALAGFALGQVFCLALLGERVFLEFPVGPARAAAADRPWRKYWTLALIGLLYPIGVWAEKFMYWFSPAGKQIAGFFRTFPTYDSAILLAYLLTIPASAVLLVNVETDFYRHYRDFYTHVLGKDPGASARSSPGTFEEITRARRGMIQAARSGFFTLIKLQGLVAGFALLLAPDLARLVGLPGASIPTLRIAVLAASGQVLVLFAVLLLLYVDARGPTIAVVTVFAASNLGLTWWAARQAPGLYGLGYLLCTIVTTLFGMVQLRSVLGRLDYLTFMLQPLEPARRRPLPSRTPAASLAKVADPSPKVAT